MKKAVAILLCAVLMTAMFTVAAGALTETSTEIDGGYYVVFKGDNDTVRLRNRMVLESGHYAAHNLTMSLSTPFKIAYSTDLETVTTLYPAGADDYYVPRYSSRYFTVEFTPNGNNGGSGSDMGWYDGYVRAYPCEPPVEGSDEIVPVTDKEIKRNLYKDAFVKAFPHCAEDYTYDELYYHQNEWGYTDWTLVQVVPDMPNTGDYYGVFDEMVLFSAEYDPFDFTYGVYDVRQHAFYSITEAWDMGYADLHDVFVHILKSGGCDTMLGDVDGDGELSIIDATLIQRSLVGMVDPEDFSWWCKHYSCSFGTRLTSLGDYDDDGECDITDVTLIQRALAGMERYPHDFTMSVALEKVGDTVQAVASSSFGDKPVQYRYTITCIFHGGSEYNWDDFGAFEIEESWPGTFWLTSGNINSDRVEIPVTSLTYNDYFTLTVTALDAHGNETQPAELYFINVY